MSTIHNFIINNHKELIDIISKWNLTNSKYPIDFPKDKIKPLLNEYISVEDYRLKFEIFFYLEAWEPFKDFNTRLNKREINFEENAVDVRIEDFTVMEDISTSVNDNKLFDCYFTILMPNYFIYGYQGMKFSKKSIEDTDIERRTSGDIKKHDFIFLAKMDKSLKKIHYKTIVMSNIQKEFDKNLVTISKRTNLCKYSPVVCTKRMTKKEITEFKNMYRKKRDNDSCWICYHVMTFGTIKKEFKTMDLLVTMPNLKIRKEITTGKCRNENTLSKDKSKDILSKIMCDYNLDDQKTSLILKIYKNNILFRDERNILVNLLMPDGSQNIDNTVIRVINNIQKGIFPFPLQDKKILYKNIISSENQEIDNELENLLYNSDEKIKFNKIVSEVIQQYGLNTTQATILAAVNNEEHLSLIQGPPGTGKTKMILAFTYQELRLAKIKRKKSKILICAPSNAACNEITRRLKKENINTNIMTVRFIVDDNADNTISHVSVDKVALRKLYNIIRNEVIDFAKSISMSDTIIEELDFHINSIQNKIKELLSNRKGLNIVISSKAKNKKKIINKLYQRVCLLENELDQLIQMFIDYLLLIDDNAFEDYKDHIIATAKEYRMSIFEEADVIITTLSSSNSEYFKNIKNKFTLLVIDEASQASELTTLIPFCHNIPKAILIGDPNQLPPTILNSEAADNFYGKSLFQRLQENSPNSVHLLNIQYRMHPNISKLSSRCFYSNEIINGENVKSSNWNKPWCNNSNFGPLMFYDIKGVTNKSNNSLNNVTESNQILNFITQLLLMTPKLIYSYKISIISPYRAQVLLIRNRLRQYYKEMLDQLKLDHTNEFDFLGEKVVISDENKELLKKINILDFINVNTIDSFQGQESDIVLLSCVRSGTKSVGFLSDKRRLNVAITRARYSLIIFGDSETLCKDKYWNNIITEMKHDKCFKANAKDYFKYSKHFPKNLFPKSFFK
ncbi:P-loop containing nucleoside triphosphate hydrolase protein [Piromyces finnis]|uniref:p-loop containing nucleoside triphosphate hydrolase protein n=1 Tax=Piromyces finnis TaxID=1754191 RepID=A0A1Y1UX60_9FUNG|nr:P-loop containing nucleoside triphosphate hydrolase protein [Piromyces finnis]|eukprot:ORX42804.1 P-loop containing nucleoside triphosphate hydrolase protein [Piromyces finnis]